MLEVPSPSLWGGEESPHNHYWLPVHILEDCYAWFTFSLRLSRNCEWDEVLTNVDIYTLVWELRDRYNSRKSRDTRELAQFHSSTFFTTLQTTIYIQELNENVITVPLITRRDIWDILVSFDSGTDLLTCFQELQDKTRTGWECDRPDECTLHTLVLISCCLGENVYNKTEQSNIDKSR